jgi:glycogen operon protein
MTRRLSPGDPEPLGVTSAADGINVAVFSAHASAIELCLFDAAGEREVERIALPERTGDVFHAFVPGVAPGTRYGLRAHGPYDPANGQRFNPAKLLVDPYAIGLDRAFALHPAMFGEAPDGSRDDRDSAAAMPKAVVGAVPSPATGPRPRVPWSRTIVYELHVRGYTQRHPDVPHALRGTCAGLASRAAIEHLARLGVTTVELMPIAAAIDERHLAHLGLTNYWGYNPVAFLAPDPRLAPRGIDELRETVAALHEVGIEVLLDVVFNHTGEGDARGPTVSLRGLDNATYYRHAAAPAGIAHGLVYVNDTGCGNTLALDRPPVLRLVLDALRHYARATGVDGFRFDLATTLGRRATGFDPAAPLLAAIDQDPELRGLKLVAEPWDIGPGGYQLGAFPAAWGEWNDRYRDSIRRYWRGDAGMTGELATRLAGSGDVLGPRARPPSRSVNFVTAHDGFTAADLVAYERKHNDANGEANRDGTDANHSWNHGVEGPTDDGAIRAARARDVRNLLATLLASRGTPMLAMGDELGRTQHGNNNAYAQDSAMTWVDWAAADTELAAFVARLIAIRHAHPALRDDRLLTGAPVDDTAIPDVEWRRPDGAAMAPSDWAGTDRHALVAALYTPAHDDAAADRVVVAINAGPHPLSVTLPEPRDGFAWSRLIDTALPVDGAPEWQGEGPETLPVAARSVVLLAEKSVGRPSRARRGIEPEVLARLAAAAGIATDWWDVAGQRHVVGPDTQRALLGAMDLAIESTGDARARLVELAAMHERRLLPAVVVARTDVAITVPLAVAAARRPTVALHLATEDGAVRTFAATLADLPGNAVRGADGRVVAQALFALPALPPGYHSLTVEGDPRTACRIAVAPPRCHEPPELAGGRRRFGLAAHLYTLRRAGDQGIGDFTTLAEVAAASARAGAITVGLNPLHALFAQDRERASPYHPSDRRFLEPIYIDVAAVADLERSPAARALLATNALAVADLGGRRQVDYPAVWEIKRAVLEACCTAHAERPPGDPLVAEFARFAGAGGEALHRFAVFSAIAAAHPRVPWFRWPAGLRRPDAPDVAAFAAAHPDRVRFELYLQWQADRQLAAADRAARASGLALGFYRDLAVGAAPDGAENWAEPGLHARGASVGAPPDPFSQAGQIWDLPPVVPHALHASAYRGFRELLTANFRHAGALRIDHAMGLARLFWVPDGAKAAEGAYVRYPLDDLLGVLALESVRARCLVVAEDLGTVPEGFRERLAAAGVLSSRVFWFERSAGGGFAPPAHYPAAAAACVSTHDLPTIAGWWSGADLEERAALGLVPDVAQARRERGEERHAMIRALELAGAAPPGQAVDEAGSEDVAAAIHRYVGRTPSALALIQADDLAGERDAVNLPGTDRERPNWRRRHRVDAATLWRTTVGVAAATDLGPSRGPGPAVDAPAAQA